MTDLHERKCWSCGNVAEHADRVVPHVLCRICGSQDTRATKKPKPFEPTKAQLHSACLSYRHDYGVMDEQARESLRFTALEWFRAWQKEGLTR
jgi:hypothetical protein